MKRNALLYNKVTTCITFLAPYKLSSEVGVLNVLL